MSRRANPVTIGIFVSGAFALLAGLIVFFGTAQFYEKTEKFILFFDESVNGLSVGSAVKFKGVPIGRVTKILIRAENQPLSSSAIPVIIELDVSRLERDLNVGIDFSDEQEFADQIANGLRAKLNTESLITGLLFIEIDYVQNAGQPVIIQETLAFKEIPTVPSTVQELTQQVMETIAVLGEVDLEETILTVQKMIELARVRLEELDVPRMVDSFTGVTDSVERFLDSTDLSETITNLDKALVELTDVVNTIEDEAGTVRENLTSTLEDVSGFVGEATVTLEAFNQSFGEDSRVVYELQRTLQSISEAADSVRRLSDFLERNPNALVSGRAAEG